MTKQEANDIYDQGREVIVGHLVEITNRLKALENQLKQNSQNSSKPPSSDPLAKKLKPMSLRKKTGKKPGGQFGHEGATLKQVEKPDQILSYLPEVCRHCQASLAGVESDDLLLETLDYTRRQVFEMPEPKVIVTEHRACKVICPCCGKQNQASFPDLVKQPVQYGANLLGFACYLHSQHLLPYARTAQIVNDITGAPFSAGTLHTALKTAFERLLPFEEQIKIALQVAGQVHADETGGRVDKSLHWFHVRATKRLTYLFCHVNRGKKAIEDLLSYRGLLISDFFSNYVSLTCAHQFCMAHICRELLGAYELTKNECFLSLKEHLEKCHAACERARARGAKTLWNARKLADDFEDLINKALKQTPLVPDVKKRSKARCLLDRLDEYYDACVGFLFDLTIPFTNNEAERDLRMLKVKGKISGSFRTFSGAEHFSRVRSYLQTCGKQGLNRLDCLRSIFANDLIMPILD
jgi:transposase